MKYLIALNIILSLIILIKMANDKETILAVLARIQSGLTNVAGDIRTLKDGIVPGMSQADVDEIAAKAEELAVSIENLAAETPETEG